MANYYWAKFENIGNNIHRYDTRVYLIEINKPSDNDKCLGAIVGKNPGSARGTISNKLVNIHKNGDKLLGTVRNIFLEAYKKYQQGGVITDNRGQWAHPGKVTRITSPNITMQDVNYPVLGISEQTGEQKLMMPNLNYFFNNTKSVIEYPITNGQK